MFAVLVTREMRPVGVLLGGSGRARMRTTRAPHVAVLLKPCLSASAQTDRVTENRALEAASC